MTKTIAIIMAVIAVAAGSVAAFAILSNNDSDGPESPTVTVTDMLGEQVKVKKNPEHVACVSRTTYDLLVAFGLGDRIDGVYNTLLENEWTSILYPGSKDHYAYPYEPSHELLIERNVDLVFCPEKYIADGLKEHGIAALNVSLYGNPDFSSYVFFLADLAEQLWPDVDGVKEKAETWKAEFKAIIDDVDEKIDSLSPESRTVYYVRGDKNKGINYTDTGKSFNEYIFDLLGLEFLGRELGTSKPSTEAILEADPQVIVIGGNYQHTLRALLDEGTWANISAVKSDEIYRIGIGFSPMEQMGTFSPVFLADMANKLYPETFHYDTAGMLKDMCQRYFGVTLTDEQASYMLDGLGPDGKPMA